MTIGPFQTSRIQRKIGPADRRLFERGADVGVRHRSIRQDDVGEVHQATVTDEAGEPSWTKEKLMHVGQHRPRVARQEFFRPVPEVPLAQSGHCRVDGDEERRGAGFLRALEAGSGNVTSTDQIELVPQRSLRSGADFVDAAA